MVPDYILKFNYVHSITLNRMWNLLIGKNVHHMLQYIPNNILYIVGSH